MPRFMFDGEMNLTSGKQVLGKRGKMKGRWIEVPRKDDGEFVWNFGALA